MLEGWLKNLDAPSKADIAWSVSRGCRIDARRRGLGRFRTLGVNMIEDTPTCLADRVGFRGWGLGGLTFGLCGYGFRVVFMILILCRVGFG